MEEGGRGANGSNVLVRELVFDDEVLPPNAAGRRSRNIMLVGLLLAEEKCSDIAN